MHPEVQELQSKLKEILYDCAVELKATKAALYLQDGAGRFELVTQYGFRGGLAESADKDHPLIDRCGRGRTAFIVNGLTVEPRFSEMLYEAATDRLLAAPVYLRGKLVGVIDMRDKSAKALFDKNDLPKAQLIADRIAELFTNKNVFGQRFITLSDSPQSTVLVATHGSVDASSSAAPGPAAAPRPAPLAAPPLRPAAPPSPAQLAKSYVPRVPTMILEARAAAELMLETSPWESLGEAEVIAARDVLRAMLLVPGATVASLSAFGHMGGIQEVAARSTVTDEGMNFLQSKLNMWLTKRGEGGGVLRTNVQHPFGTSSPAIAPAQMQKVFTAPIAAGSLRGIYLTVAFAANPDRAAHEMLAAFHAQLQLAIEHSMIRGAAQSARWRIAEKLLEPDFSHYPELRRHSDSVVARVEAFARFIALTPAEVDTARVVALVHDCGMRLLDYDRLYRKRDISQDEMSILQEHVQVGAAIVEPLLGAEVARAVLCHHERFDGRGYPNALHGEEIPRMARIIQICDAYEMMIADDNYQPPESPEKALSILTRGAGSQFDAELAHRFAEMIRSAR
ncbi:MAG: HD domain-containing phosphohydrolase [Acidobacteriota bacterium]